jgi:hypothetical protein
MVYPVVLYDVERRRNYSQESSLNSHW